MLMARYFNRFKSLEAALPWLLILMGAGYVAYYWSNPVGLYPDSNGYLTFSEHRTAGYPIFIGLTTTLFGTVDAVPKVQLVIAAGGVCFSGLEPQSCLPVVIRCAGAGFSTDVVSSDCRRARLHFDGVSLHLVAVHIHG